MKKEEEDKNAPSTNQYAWTNIDSDFHNNIIVLLDKPKNPKTPNKITKRDVPSITRTKIQQPGIFHGAWVLTSCSLHPTRTVGSNGPYCLLSCFFKGVVFNGIIRLVRYFVS